jgi:hypothetical protein
VNVDHDVIVGALQFDNINRSGPNVTISGVIGTSYNLTGSGITIQASGGGEGLIRAVDGGHTIASAVTLASNTRIAVNPSNTLTLSNLQPSSVSVTKSGGGDLTVNNVRAAALNITAGKVKVSGNGSPTGTSKVTALTLAAGATLDLTDNKLITATPIGGYDGNASAYTGILRSIQTGRNGGSWTGAGIITSKTAAASPALQTTLAVATADEIGRVGQTFGGITAASGDTLIMYTYGGDANLSGYIDADDYFQIDSHYGKTADAAKSYFNGDFNYDGLINGDDYAMIDANFSNQNPAFASSPTVGGVSAVPEPASLLALPLLAALRIRRRKRA